MLIFVGWVEVRNPTLQMGSTQPTKTGLFVQALISKNLMFGKSHISNYHDLLNNYGGVVLR